MPIDYYGLRGGCETDTARPVAPASFLCTQVDNTTMDLEWDETSADFDFIDLERSLSAGDYVSIATIYPTLPAAPVVWTDTGLTKNTRYYYRFRCKKRMKWSDYQTDNEITTNL